MPLREMNREQAWLLPPTLDELVPSDHARFVAAWMRWTGRTGQNWVCSRTENHWERRPTIALLSVWRTNVRSCRKLEAACRDQIRG